FGKTKSASQRHVPRLSSYRKTLIFADSKKKKSVFHLPCGRRKGLGGPASRFNFRYSLLIGKVQQWSLRYSYQLFQRHCRFFKGTFDAFCIT
ncbi:MAG TPA: hypothetical protein PLF41_16140, partial [Anaerolineales bacterium]|nr:hypothetical protein [Anaerolineales bacterium]